jgi:hypothetical protein
MSLATRFDTSCQLLKTSLRVLRDHPRLIVFPMLSVMCSLVLAVFFLLPAMAWTVTATRWNEWDFSAKSVSDGAFYAAGVAIYLAAMFVGTFFNVAFYHAIIRAFAGEPIDLRGGLRFARGRWRAILMWSLLASTVGLVIHTIEERLGWLGKIMMGLVGTVWSVAAVFAIPVIIRRADSNPLAVLRDSAATLKRTWGESLIGFVGLRLAGLALIGGPLLFFFAAIIGWGFFHFGWAGLTLATTGILGVFAGGLLLSVATAIYRCALYVYASEGVVPTPYTAEMMNAAWKVKKARA